MRPDSTELLNPALVFPLIWLCVLIASPLSSIDFHPYTETFYWYLFAAIGAFVIGVGAARILAIYFATGPHPSFRNIAFEGPWVLYLYIGAMTIALVIQGQNRAALIGDQWWTPENIVRFRALVTEDRADQLYPWVAYANFFFFSAIPVWMCYRAGRILWFGLVTLLLAFVYFSSARASIFTIALIAYFFHWLMFGFRAKLTVASLLILIAAYFLIALMTGKTAEAGDHFGLLAYALAPSHALDQILSVQTIYSDGPYTFKFLARFFGHNPDNDPFYSTPLLSNVYTIFGPYVLDYGVQGSLLALFTIGVVSGVLFFLERRGDPYFVFLYSMVLALLCLSVFHDHFTSSGYVWASVVLGLFFIPRTRALPRPDGR